jgi:hypothetical protein
MLPHYASGIESTGLLVVERFEVGEALHFKLNMPVVRPPMAERKEFIVILSVVSLSLSTTLFSTLNEVYQQLQFIINVQHDCQASECDVSGIRRQLQERQESNKIIRTITHRDDTNFIINMHAIHNAMLLRKFLPRYLVLPQHIFANQQQRLDLIGAKLAVDMVAKKAATQAKANETQRKKQEACTAAEVVRETAGPSSLQMLPAKHYQGQE